MSLLNLASFTTNPLINSIFFSVGISLISLGFGAKLHNCNILLISPFHLNFSSKYYLITFTGLRVCTRRYDIYYKISPMKFIILFWNIRRSYHAFECVLSDNFIWYLFIRTICVSNISLIKKTNLFRYTEKHQKSHI